MILSMIIAFFWNSLAFAKNFIHSILDPTLGILLSWNVTWGMLLIVLLLTFITTVLQKYTTDQETIKDLKRRQKEISKKSQEFKNDPKRMMEIQKEIMPISMKMMKLSMRPIVYTGIPFILSFRWFMDYFTKIPDFRFFGFLSWFWFYLIFVLVFGMILRKILKVV